MRLPVIDPERGSCSLLHYVKDQPARQMYASEVFKIVSGRIVRVDNIGLMMQGVATLGFIH